MDAFFVELLGSSKDYAYLCTKRIIGELFFDYMIKLFSYRKQVKALEHIRDYNTNRKEMKNLFGDDGILVFEEAQKLGAIYSSSMDISRKNDILTTIIKKHKDLYHEELLSMIKWGVGILIGGGCLIGVHITFNYIKY